MEQKITLLFLLFFLVAPVQNITANDAQQRATPINPESYFNKRFHEIDSLDHQLSKALDDTTWNSMYMFFISYFRKPSPERVQNMRDSMAIIENRIQMLEALLVAKKEELKQRTAPAPRQKRQGGFDPFDLKDFMGLFGAILWTPIALIEDAMSARSIQHLKDGINKTERVINHLGLYRVSLDRYLKKLG